MTAKAAKLYSGYKKTLTEKDITKQIRDVLRACHVWHFKHWSGPMTYPKGIADILGVHNGRFLAIEIKRPGGRVTPEQNRFIKRVNDEGGIGFVAYSVDDVIQELNLGVKLNPLFG